MPAPFVSRVTIGTTATTIATEQLRHALVVRNLGPGNLYVGGAGVSTSTGYPVGPNEALVLGAAQWAGAGGEGSTSLVGISDSSCTVAVLEIR